MPPRKRATKKAASKEEPKGQWPPPGALGVEGEDFDDVDIIESLLDTDDEDDMVLTETPKPTKSTKPTSKKGETTMAQTAETRPEYGIGLVDELPEDEPTGRKMLFHDLLLEVANVAPDGEWCEVAHYKTPVGARNALKALESGDRAVPEDTEWEFAARKVPDPDNPSKRHSKLFARVAG